MRPLALALALFCCGPALAAPLDDDIARLEAIAKKEGARAELTDYDMRAFSPGKFAAEVLAEARGKDASCKLQPVPDKNLVATLIGLFQTFLDDDKEAETIVKRLDARGELAAAAGYFWDGFQGRDEICDVEMLRFHFANGKALTIRRP